MLNFREIDCGSFWVRAVDYPDGSIGLMVPYGREEWITLTATPADLAEIAKRLETALERLKEEVPTTEHEGVE